MTEDDFLYLVTCCHSPDEMRPLLKRVQHDAWRRGRDDACEVVEDFQREVPDKVMHAILDLKSPYRVKND